MKAELVNKRKKKENYVKQIFLRSQQKLIKNKNKTNKLIDIWRYFSAYLSHQAVLLFSCNLEIAVSSYQGNSEKTLKSLFPVDCYVSYYELNTFPISPIPIYSHFSHIFLRLLSWLRSVLSVWTFWKLSYIERKCMLVKQTKYTVT